MCYYRGKLRWPGAQTAARAGDPRKAADELLASLDNQYVLAQEETIRRELATRGLPDTSPETVRVLTHYTAAAFVALDLERINNVIWGSQINILDHLNASAGARREELLPYYEAAAVRYPDAFQQYPFEQYVDFLLSRRLGQPHEKSPPHECRRWPPAPVRTFLPPALDYGIILAVGRSGAPDSDR